MAEVGWPVAGERAGSKGMREDAAQAVQAVRAVQTV
jgi:exo-beta-1,3-glucanase (GH17 family)